jgi:hypothetical protein
MSYKIDNITFNVDLNDVSSEINALKMALALSIFSHSNEHALNVLKSLKEINDPHIQKIYKELLQFSPANAAKI